MSAGVAGRFGRGRLGAFIHQLTRPASIAAPIATFIVLAVLFDPGWGTTGALLVIVAVVWNAIRSAPARARDAFFDSYAAARGLSQDGSGSLPDVTPILCMGDDRYAERVLSGELPGGQPALLAQYVYEERTGSGDTQTIQKSPFTLVLQSLPRVGERELELYCWPRSNPRFTDRGRDKPTGLKRLELESEPLDKRYEIWFSPDGEELWMKRIFNPSFIVWLADRPPRGFCFELMDENLCAYISGHTRNAEALDVLRTSAAVVGKRLVDEASE